MTAGTPSGTINHAARNHDGNHEQKPTAHTSEPPREPPGTASEAKRGAFPPIRGNHPEPDDREEADNGRLRSFVAVRELGGLGVAIRLQACQTHCETWSATMALGAIPSAEQSDDCLI